MKLVYPAVVVLVVIAIALLTYTTLSQREALSDEEITALGNEINSIDTLMGQFEDLDNLSLSEINESIFNP
jgi:hypothetical protein